MKTVLITGATSGFGKGLVEQFLNEGFTVVATGRNLLSRRNLFEKSREQFKNQLIELNLDVTNENERNEIVNFFTNHPLDILVNNAGFAVFGPAEECTEESIRKQFEVNFFGLVLITQKLLPFIRKSQGQIINVSSILGLMGLPLSSFYCASKYAVEGFSEALSYELKPFGVKVVLIEPGGYRTNFNNSAEWGMSVGRSDSPYNKSVMNYSKLRDKLANRPNPQNPNEVTAGIVKIAKMQNKKISYTFGKDANSTRLLKKILSRNTFHNLTGYFLNRVFNKDLN
jgi:short-subunit dehydrogenase